MNIEFLEDCLRSYFEKDGNLANAPDELLENYVSECEKRVGKKVQFFTGDDGKEFPYLNLVCDERNRRFWAKNGY